MPNRLDILGHKSNRLVGFIYEADKDALKDAQDGLESVLRDEVGNKIDDVISAIEDLKGDTNIYDANGNLLGTTYSTPSIGNLQSLLSNYYNKDYGFGDIGSIERGLAQNIMTGSSSKSISIQIGDVNLTGVNDAETLGQSIIDLLPNAILQAINKK